MGLESRRVFDPEKDALLPQHTDHTTTTHSTSLIVSDNDLKSRSTSKSQYDSADNTDRDTDTANDDDKYTKYTKRSGTRATRPPHPACKVACSTPGMILSLLVLLFYLSYPSLTANNGSGRGERMGGMARFFPFPKPPAPPEPPFIKEGIEQCKIVQRKAGGMEWDKDRKMNDRFVQGTKPTWLKNGTIWTGNDDGEEILYGHDVLLDGGVVRKIGTTEEIASFLSTDPFFRALSLKDHSKDMDQVDLHGSWVTPGIVDLHSHMGVDSAPEMEGSEDTNSMKGPILPWLRSLDAFNTHDMAFNLSISGGITTMLVLPGSAGNIGGTAYTFKPRWTAENTPQSMQVEPPFLMKNGSWERTRAWRHIKHACGENPARTFGNTRLDSAYDFRRAYNEGRELKDKQDRWCASPQTQTEPFPNSLQWEPLADVIRGNVKVNIHCYETVDLNDLVRISNEFKFHIQAFHHAHETYLVPDLLKQVYGGAPSVAIFATNARYKREAYRGSEFAPKILADEGINVVMKSDHPVLDSRYLMFEAAQAHIYGLNHSQALGTVTTHSAHAMGLDHRVGYVRQGYDADIVVWDSFPLTLGATPKQTYIDGIPQIINPHVNEKPKAAQQVFPEGQWDEEIKETLAARGDPDLRPKRSSGTVIFQDVAGFYLPQSPHYSVQGLHATDGQLMIQGQGAGEGKASVVVRDGKIECVGQCAVEEGLEFDVIDLKGGSIAPGYISVGSYMGLMEIRQEEETWDGTAYDPLKVHSDILDGLVVHAADGIRFGGKDQLLAYRSGMTTGVSYPISDGLFSGLSCAYSTGASHPLSPGAILNPTSALHISLDNEDVSISTKLAVLRRMLQPSPKDKDGNDLEPETELQKEVHAVKRGYRRLVVEVNRADVMASLIRMKRDWAPGMQMTFLGAAESWMLADELVQFSIGVVVAPARSFPATWDQRRILPGPPISNHSLVSYLASKGVLVGIGAREEWETRNARYEAGWIYANSRNVHTRQGAIDLVSTNLEELLGLNDRKGLKKGDEGTGDLGMESWVAYEGDLLTFEGRVRGVKGYARDVVDLF